MTTPRRIFIATSLAVLACSYATAASMSVTCSLASGPTELGPTTNGAITCADFNIAGDTLTSISLTINGAVIAPSLLTITNTDPATHTGSASTDSTYNLDASTPLAGFAFPLNG